MRYIEASLYVYITSRHVYVYVTSECYNKMQLIFQAGFRCLIDARHTIFFHRDSSRYFLIGGSECSYATMVEQS